MTSSYSPDQQAAEDHVLASLEQGVSVTTLGGLAGTGKTWLLGQMATKLTQKGLSIAFATPTGKASLVLVKSLQAAGINIRTSDEGEGHWCGTLHRLLYKPIMEEATGKILGWTRRERATFDLIVLDEASMIDDELIADVISLGAPILAVGDHGQLSPVGPGKGLMQNPDVRLETIHRQAEGNPVIQLSMRVRLERPSLSKVIKIAQKINDDRVQVLEGYRSEQEVINFCEPPDGLLIVHSNQYRSILNTKARKVLLGARKPEPRVGDAVLVCKNSYLPDLLANGTRGVIKEILTKEEESEDHIYLVVDFFDIERVKRVRASKYQFLEAKTFQSFVEIPSSKKFKTWEDVGVLLDYGYSLTCHRSVHEDTLIKQVGQPLKKIKDFKPGDLVKGVDDNGFVIETEVVALHDHGTLPGIEVEFDDGYKIVCSPEHKFLTEHGQVPIRDIIVRGLEVVCAEENGLAEPMRSDIPKQASFGESSSSLCGVQSSSEILNGGDKNRFGAGALWSVVCDEKSVIPPRDMRSLSILIGEETKERWVGDSVWHNRTKGNGPTGSSQDVQYLQGSYRRQHSGASSEGNCYQQDARRGCCPAASSEGSCTASRGVCQKGGRWSSVEGESSRGSSKARRQARSRSTSVEENTPRGGTTPSREGHGRSTSVGEGQPRKIRGSLASAECNQFSKLEGVAGEAPRRVQSYLAEDGFLPQAQVIQNGGMAQKQWHTHLARGTGALWREVEASGLRFRESLGGGGRLLALLCPQRYRQSKSTISDPSSARRYAEQRSETARSLLDPLSRRLLRVCERQTAQQLVPVAFSDAPLSSTRGLVRRRVVRFHSVGLQRMYDLEVAHPKHNFLLPTGIVTSNSQGSSAKNVGVMLSDSLGVMDDEERNRWVYTAITRSSENLVLVDLLR